MKSRDLELASFYLFFDIIILNIAIILTGFVEAGFSFREHTGLSIYLLQGNLAALITYLSYNKRNPYLEDSFKKRFVLNLKRTIVFIVISTGLSILLIPQIYSGIFFLKYTLLFFAGELMFHWLLFNHVKYRRSRGINTNHVIIVGMNETAWVLRKAIESDLLMGFKFVGFISDDNTEFPDWIGRTDELPELLSKHHIEILFVHFSMFLK